MRIFVKGSPERIREKCLKKSVPFNYHDILSEYALQGYRIISIATKTKNYTEIDELERDEVESNLIFLGFLIFRNILKPQTAPTIKKLQKANVKAVMATGDNIMTAVSVAR